MVLEIRIKVSHLGCTYTDLSKIIEFEYFDVICNNTVDLLVFPGHIDKKIENLIEDTLGHQIQTTINHLSDTHSYVLITCTFTEKYSPIKIINNNKGLLFNSIKYGKGFEYYYFITPDTQSFKNILQELENGDIKVEILEIREAEKTKKSNYLFEGTPITKILSALSEKQLDIIINAYSRGYYEIPRKIKLSELADENNVSRQSIERILRKAEGKIMDVIVPSIYQGEEHVPKTPNWFHETLQSHKF